MQKTTDEWRTSTAVQIISLQMAVLLACCTRQRGGEKEKLHLFSSFAKNTVVACAWKAFLASLFSVFCAMLAALTNWIQYILIHILPNSQKADHGVKAVLAESVPPNAGIQRAADRSWKIVASVCRQPRVHLPDFTFHSTSFHLYGSKLNTQTGM